jgi:Ca-activated chloride channel homolog
VVCALLLSLLAAAAIAWARPQIQDQSSQPPPPPGAAGAQAAPANGKDGYTIQSNVSLVVLHASVFNERGVFVPGLQQDDFRVYEDKVEQKLSVFKQEDVPVSVGLVIDNSGSMRDKRPQVNAAALTFVQTSNPQDEAFVVNFNDDYYLDTEHDFTSDVEEMKAALERIDARGSTALYDAVIGSLDHLKKGHKDKKVLLVITDGEDDFSHHTLADTITEARHSDAIIYAIGVYGADDTKSDKRKAQRALEQLADATGGAAYFPEDVGDTEAICAQIAHDIRNQYTLAYYPTNAAQDGTFRSVVVQVFPPRGMGKLTVRTRSGYYAHQAAPAD